MDQKARRDKFDRNERIVDTQIEGARWLDNKSLDFVRLAILLLGVLLTGISVLIALDLSVGESQYPAVFSFVMGVFFLHASVVFCLLTSFSSMIIYGPRPLGGKDMNHLGDRHFDEIISMYQQNIESNDQDLKVRVKRFRKSVILLFGAIIHISIAPVLFMIPSKPILEYVFVLLLALVIIHLTYQIPNIVEL